jgi:hypothetical protein
VISSIDCSNQQDRPRLVSWIAQRYKITVGILVFIVIMVILVIMVVMFFWFLYCYDGDYGFENL